MIRNILSIIIIAMIYSCESTGELSSDKALSMVEDYMEDKPIFETGKFDTQKVRLNTSKDQPIITELQRLEDEGFLDIMDEKKRKKWFSKDSIFIITPILTDKAHPYVVKQNRNNTVVKTLLYKLDDNQTVTFEKKTDKVAIFNVMMLKEPTPFYKYGKDANPHSDFITRKFKAKYNPEIGWHIVK